MSRSLRLTVVAGALFAAGYLLGHATFPSNTAQAQAVQPNPVDDAQSVTTDHVRIAALQLAYNLTVNSTEYKGKELDLKGSKQFAAEVGETAGDIMSKAKWQK